MYLSVAPGGIVSLHEPDDCTRLHLALPGVDAGSADAALRVKGLGRMRGEDDAVLELVALRALAEPAATAPAWSESWDAMIGYAGRKGWLSEDGTAVQVHVERAPR